MTIALLKAVAGFVPVGLLLAGSALLALRERRVSALLQLAGALGFVLVVSTHLFEALDLLPWMHWGREGSNGHYVDLMGAAIGVVLFPIGYLLHATSPRM